MISTADRYTRVAIGLHWLIGLAILGQLALGLAMTQFRLPTATMFGLYQLHKSIGITILLAVLVRVAWRLGHRPPPLPPVRQIERQAAGGAHLLLYGLMLGLPLTGWALVSASRFNIPTVLYGVLPWPHLPWFAGLSAADKPPTEAALKTIHAVAAFVLIALVALHVAAALRHHFLLRDNVLARMLPWRPSMSRRLR